LSLGLVASACSRVDDKPSRETASASPKPSTAKKLTFTRAGPGKLVDVVAAHARAAEAQGRTPLVYVGARWCEPCQYFHKAAEAGELDGAFGDVSILELDADDDGPRLAAAGYASTYVPLFVVPGKDGRGSERRMAGSIKGPGAVAEITPRLQKLLGR
jgi:thiol-disulfide isomerase/thioredoxin